MQYGEQVWTGLYWWPPLFTTRWTRVELMLKKGKNGGHMLFCEDTDSLSWTSGKIWYTYSWDSLPQWHLVTSWWKAGKQSHSYQHICISIPREPDLTCHHLTMWDQQYLCLMAGLTMSAILRLWSHQSHHKKKVRFHWTQAVLSTHLTPLICGQLQCHEAVNRPIAMHFECHGS